MPSSSFPASEAHDVPWRLAEAMRRATRLGVPLRFEMRETLDRLAGGVPHQGDQHLENVLANPTQA